MPLVIKSDVTINPAGTQLFVEFRQATGDYDVDDNPGGFGAPNPARNTLAAIIFSEHKLTSGDVAANVSAYNPLTVESFTIAITKAVNGVLNINIFLLPIFDSGGSYSDDDVVWDNTNPASPFIKKMIDSVWTPVESESLIGDSNVVQYNTDSFPIPDAIRLENKLNRGKLKKLRALVYKNCGREDYEPLRNQYEYVEGLIHNAVNAFCAKAFNEAQSFIEEVFTFETKVVEANE